MMMPCQLKIHGLMIMAYNNLIYINDMYVGHRVFKWWRLVSWRFTAWWSRRI